MKLLPNQEFADEPCYWQWKKLTPDHRQEVRAAIIRGHYSMMQRYQQLCDEQESESKQHESDNASEQQTTDNQQKAEVQASQAQASQAQASPNQTQTLNQSPIIDPSDPRAVPILGPMLSFCTTDDLNQVPILGPMPKFLC